jgi:hypothetical protein
MTKEQFVEHFRFTEFELFVPHGDSYMRVGPGPRLMVSPVISSQDTELIRQAVVEHILVEKNIQDVGSGRVEYEGYGLR